MQEVRVQGLLDRVSLLKERNMNLESVIVRWKEEVKYSGLLIESLRSGSHSSSSSSRLNSLDLDVLVASVPSDALPPPRREATPLLDERRDLSDRVTELEEQHLLDVDEKEQLSSQCVDLRKMNDALLSEQEAFKVAATRQLSQLRADLEVAHAAELRQIRVTYERDRHLLLDELKDIGRAVADAQVLTGPSLFKEEGVVEGEEEGGEGEGEVSIRHGHDFNESIRKHLEAIEREFSLSQSESAIGEDMVSATRTAA
jgi:hypothetical protein